MAISFSRSLNEALIPSVFWLIFANAFLVANLNFLRLNKRILLKLKDKFYQNGDFEYQAKMNGAEIFDFTMNNIAPSLKKLLEFSSQDKDDFDYYIFHQANKFILQNIARQLEIDENKMPIKTLSQFGNQCGASIPCTISDQLKNNIQSKKVLMSGFGAGLSWASAIINLDNIYCSKLNEYKGEINE